MSALEKDVPLEELQAFIASAIRHTEPLPTHEAMSAQAARLATGNGRLSPVEQLEIYREQFWLRHVGSLEEDYPTLRFLLGAEAFEELCRKYLQAHPPQGASLRDLAEAMPRFVAETEPYGDDALLADCARTEWAFIEAFDAADAPLLDPAVLGSTDEEAWPAARIVLHPSIRLVELQHAAHLFRASVRKDEKPARPAPEKTFLVVDRADETVRYATVDPLAFALLGRLQKGEPLGSACEAVAALPGAEDLGAKIGAWFQAWVSYGWLCEVRV